MALGAAEGSSGQPQAPQGCGRGELLRGSDHVSAHVFGCMMCPQHRKASIWATHASSRFHARGVRKGGRAHAYAARSKAQNCLAGASVRRLREIGFDSAAWETGVLSCGKPVCSSFGSAGNLCSSASERGGVASERGGVAHR
eukprot:855364-Rhodomonas_salina.1